MRLALDNLGMRLGHNILVLDRYHRDIDSDHAAGLPREIASRRDDMLASYVALVGRDFPFAARQPPDSGDRRVAVDLSAALARAARQRLRQVGGLNVAVLEVLDRANDFFDIAERPDCLDLSRREEFDLDADRFRDARVIIVFVHPVAGQREANVRHLTKTGVEPGSCSRVWYSATEYLWICPTE